MIGIKTATAEELTTPIINRQPFDRITLNADNNGAAIETLLLDLPGRKVPNPLPTEGNLTIRRLSEPSVEYVVSWSSIQKVELFEQMVLAEANRLVDDKQFIVAYDYLEFLHNNYAKLSGLANATDHYLHADALASFAAGSYDEALAILQTLYERDSNYAGLGRAVETVSDRLIRQHLANKNYAAARHVLELLQRAFGRLDLDILEIWQQRFRNAANKQIDLARAALQENNYPAVRAALRQAMAIMPSVPGARELQEELIRKHPEVVVGVSTHAPTPISNSRDGASPLADWAEIRVSRLVNPPFIGLTDFGTEGGVYASRWANLDIDDSGRELSLSLTSDALRLGIKPDEIALHLLSMADRNSSNLQVDFASFLEQIATSDGRDVQIRWRRTHVRPESLLRMSVRSLQTTETDLTSYHSIKEQDNSMWRYEREGPQASNHQGPRSIVERVFDDDQLAVKALVDAQVDLLDRVAPWHIEALQSRGELVVGKYRLPTVHVLLVGNANPLLRRREFRRALCYGIDRAMIVNGILNASQQLPGFIPLSGPFAAGLSSGDSAVGYAYNQSLQPRPYEPRLASVLASVARSAAEKHLLKEANYIEAHEGEIARDAEANDGQEVAADAKIAEVKKLILLLPAEPIARTTCQEIKGQLERISIPIELKEMPADGQATAGNYDLLYTELAMWEPIVDARRLLGPAGLASWCSPSMSLALDELDRAQNWKQAQERLRHVHQVAYYDLPVIPLWQTYNYFACRKKLRGFGEAPITCYQNVDHWRISIQ